MMTPRKRILIAVAGATLTATACTPIELHIYGARLRGAPVNVSYQGHPHYVTGPAQFSRAQCIDGIMTFEPQVGMDNAERACQANYGWVWGSLGFTQTILDP